MKVQYLGTGGAEGFPGLFCECHACKKARLLGGKNIKSRSCTLINDTVLLDVSPDIYFQAITNNINLSKVKSVIFTHSHMDHLDLFSICLRARDSASIIPELSDQGNYITLYGSNKVINDVKKMVQNGKRENINRFKLNLIASLNVIDCDGVKFYPIRTIHDPSEDCYIYAINGGNSWFLYANDSGLFSKDVYRRLEELSPCFDAVSFDCARGILSGDGHMSLEDNLTVRKELVLRGFVKQSTKYYLNHFSHMCGLVHDEMQNIADNHNFLLAYDGLIFEI